MAHQMASCAEKDNEIFFLKDEINKVVSDKKDKDGIIKSKSPSTF